MVLDLTTHTEQPACLVGVASRLLCLMQVRTSALLRLITDLVCFLVSYPVNFFSCCLLACFLLLHLSCPRWRIQLCYTLICMQVVSGAVPLIQTSNSLTWLATEMEGVALAAHFCLRWA